MNKTKAVAFWNKVFEEIESPNVSVNFKGTFANVNAKEDIKAYETLVPLYKKLDKLAIDKKIVIEALGHAKEMVGETFLRENSNSKNWNASSFCYLIIDSLQKDVEKYLNNHFSDIVCHRIKQYSTDNHDNDLDDKKIEFRLLLYRVAEYVAEYGRDKAMENRNNRLSLSNRKLSWKNKRPSVKLNMNGMDEGR